MCKRCEDKDEGYLRDGDYVAVWPCTCSNHPSGLPFHMRPKRVGTPSKIKDDVLCQEIFEGIVKNLITQNEDTDEAMDWLDETLADFGL